MVKEMAQFLGCTADLETVIAARNERGRDYWGAGQLDKRRLITNKS